jgi:hypothetical protein
MPLLHYSLYTRFSTHIPLSSISLPLPLLFALKLYRRLNSTLVTTLGEVVHRAIIRGKLRLLDRAEETPNRDSIAWWLMTGLSCLLKVYVADPLVGERLLYGSLSYHRL